MENPVHDILNLAPDTIIRLVGLEHVMWGRDMQFAGRAGDTPFTLQFLDCREMRWQIYTHMHHDNNPAFPPSELVDFKLGRSQHRSPAHLLTQHFGLSVVYGEVRLVRDGTIYLPGA